MASPSTVILGVHKVNLTPVLICSARAPMIVPTGWNVPARPPLGTPPAPLWGPAPPFQPISVPPIPAPATAQGYMSLALSALAPDWIPPQPGGPQTGCIACCAWGLLMGQPGPCPTPSALAGWHLAGEGTARAGVTLPRLLPWGSSQPLTAAQCDVFLSVSSERLKHCWSPLTVDTHRLFVQASAGRLFQNKYTDWVFSPEMAKEECSQARARTCSHLPWIFKTALHWNDIRDAWKVWTKRLDEHRVLMHMRVWEEWYACRYKLDPGLNRTPLASRRGQSFGRTVNRSHRVPLRFQRGVTSSRWRLYSEVNKDLCMFWKC